MCSYAAHVVSAHGIEFSLLSHMPRTSELLQELRNHSVVQDLQLMPCYLSATAGGMQLARGEELPVAVVSALLGGLVPKGLPFLPLIPTSILTYRRYHGLVVESVLVSLWVGAACLAVQNQHTFTDQVRGWTGPGLFWHDGAQHHRTVLLVILE